jgi:hypothetical protein
MTYATIRNSHGMTDETKIISDILGIKPIAEAVNTLTKASVDGTAAFLGRICLPAAEEFGYLLQDKVRAYRAGNVTKIAAKAEAKLAEHPEGQNLHGHHHGIPNRAIPLTWRGRSRPSKRCSRVSSLR